MMWIDKIKYACAVAGALAGGFLGGSDGFLYAVTVFVVLDYITGVMAAVAGKMLSSKVGFSGLLRKVMIFALIGVGHIIDSFVTGGYAGEAGIFRTAIICFYLANEGVSILENAAAMGLPVPESLRGALAQLREKGDKGQ